jgi:hypothetical protein
VTGLEPATSGVTGRRSNQLSYTRVGLASSLAASETRFLMGSVFPVKPVQYVKRPQIHTPGRQAGARSIRQASP